MSKKAIRILAFFGAVVALGLFLLFQLGFLSPKSTDNVPGEEDVVATAGAPEEVVPVKALRIKAEEVREIILVSGSTVANEEVTISSEVPGKVTEILFTEGTLVKKGQTMVQLDVSELDAQRKRLVVQQNLNEKIAERLKALYDNEGVSLQEYEVAVAEVEKTKAEITLIDAQIAKRTIRAPFAGRLGLRQISEGSYVSPGSPIINLVSINPIKLEFSVPEKYSRELRQGTQVDFKLDGTNRSYSARVIASEPNIDPTTRTYQLKAVADNARGEILPGAFANVTINLQAFENAIMVPTQSIVPELGGKKVYVYRNGKAEALQVETGIRKENTIQVTSGLQSGDTLITTGVLQIRPGIDVKITEIE